MTGVQTCALPIYGKFHYVHDRPAAKTVWTNYLEEKESEIKANCLVTGKKNRTIARLHPAIKGVRGAQMKGAAITSFNLSSVTSYGKNQSYNAPVSEKAAFAYTTSLNYLLRSDSRQKIQIGDATTVFWTEHNSKVEGFFGYLFDPSENETKIIRDFLKAVREGKIATFSENPAMRFYILGLSPNSSRLSVRFWHVSTVEDICIKIGQHLQDLSIVKEFKDNPDPPGMWQLLRETAPLKKLDNVSPLLSGSFVRSILTGAMYPQSLLSAVITRIRADGQINYLRAAIIKACLVRKYRFNKSSKMEVKMGLDTESTNTAYRLGRLFAVLESIQRSSQGKNLNTTIRDRYFGSASASPRAVFPKLIQLSQHHLKKIRQEKKGLAIFFDQQIEDIVKHLDPEVGFKSHLSLEEQGLFSLGYYHQKSERKIGRASCRERVCHRV